MMSEEQKPCPFCGAEPTVKRYVGDYEFAYRVKCSKCHAIGPAVYCDEPSEVARERALELWNKRRENEGSTEGNP